MVWTGRARVHSCCRPLVPGQKTCCYLKGQYYEIFDFRYFSLISFPQDPEDIIKAISNLFENVRRYSQLKVHHRWQMEKIFNQKSINYVLGHRWVVEFTYTRRKFFSFKFTLMCQQYNIIPINWRQYCWWCPFTCEYLSKFSEKIKMSLMLWPCNVFVTKPRITVLPTGSSRVNGAVF